MTHHALLNDAPDVRIVQHPERLTARLLEPVDKLLLILPERVPQSVWNSLPQGARLKAVARKRGKADDATFLTRLANKRQTLVIGGSIPSTATAFDQLDLGRKLLASLPADSGGCIGICVPGFDAGDAATIAGNVLAATLAAASPMPNYGKAGPKATIRTIRLLGLGERIETARIEAEAQGNNLARWLTCMPPNKLDARNYADILRALAKAHGWEYRRYSTKDLRTLGAGAFLAVAQGNADDSACIVRLRRRPGKKTAKADLSLVGKGIVFDTGGNNLKPFQSMLDTMNHGGHVALLGILPKGAGIDWDKVIFKGLQVQGIYGRRMFETWYKMGALLQSGLNLSPIITHHVKADDFQAGFDVMRSGQSGKVVIDWAA